MMTVSFYHNWEPDFKPISDQKCRFFAKNRTGFLRSILQNVQRKRLLPHIAFPSFHIRFCRFYRLYRRLQIHLICDILLDNDAFKWFIIPNHSKSFQYFFIQNSLQYSRSSNALLNGYVAKCGKPRSSPSGKMRVKSNFRSLKYTFSVISHFL